MKLTPQQHQVLKAVGELGPCNQSTIRRKFTTDQGKGLHIRQRLLRLVELGLVDMANGQYALAAEGQRLLKARRVTAAEGQRLLQARQTTLDNQGPSATPGAR